MAERLPSLEIIARELRGERDAQTRYADAVDKNELLLDLGSIPGMLKSILPAFQDATAVLEWRGFFGG